MFINYFKTALRNLRRNKIYSFINIAGLSLGLACAMLIMLYVKDEVSYDRFHANDAQLYRIVRKIVNPDGSFVASDGYTGYMQGPSFKASTPEIQSFVRLDDKQRDIKSGSEVMTEDIHFADTGFFSVFSFPLISGNPKTVLSQQGSVVVTERMAKKLFGTVDAVGKKIQIKMDAAFQPYIVSGVAKECPQNSSIKFQILLPLKISTEAINNKESWLDAFLNTFVILAPNANVKEAEAKINRAYATDASGAIKILKDKYDDKQTTIFLLQPIKDIHLSKDYPAYSLSDESLPQYSYLLSGIAVFILLIACINFINLTIARSIKRAKEIGIRKVVGGDRKQLIIQFLGESFVLCFMAFVLAVVLAGATLPVFNNLSNKALSLAYLFDVKLVAGYAALFIVTAFLSGFYPALVLSNFNPVQTLYNRFVLGGKNYLQKCLVVLQFMLASFLIIATITIFSQFNYLVNEKLGYDDSNLVVLGKRGLDHSEAKLLREQLSANTDIAGIAFKNRGRDNTSAKINGEDKLGFVYETVDEAYLPLLKIPVVAGRNFSSVFPSDPTNAVIVNETFVKKAGWKSPVGQVVYFWYTTEKYTVIGVIKDHHSQSVTEEIKPQLFTMKPANDYGLAYIKIKPGTTAVSLQHIEKTFKQLFPLSPFQYVFKDQENKANYETEAKWKQIMLFSAVLTIFISGIGLFGLTVLSAEKRTKEIGIRKVLGASVARVVAILSTDFLKLIVIAFIIAMPISWAALDKWLQNYPYRITLSWWMFAGAGMMVILFAMATISFHAIKAALANPVKSLKTE